MPPADDLRVGYSKLKLAKASLLGATLVATSTALAFDWLPGEADNVFARLIGWIGLLFFGLCLGVIVRRLFISGNAVVTLSSEGLTDRRVAKGLIP